MEYIIYGGDSGDNGEINVAEDGESNDVLPKRKTVVI